MLKKRLLISRPNHISIGNKSQRGAGARGPHRAWKGVCWRRCHSLGLGAPAGPWALLASVGRATFYVPSTSAGTEPEAVLESLKSWGRIWGVRLPFFLITPNLLFPPNRLNIHFRKPALPIPNKANTGLNPECRLPAAITKSNRRVITARTSAYVSGKWASDALA